MSWVDEDATMLAWKVAHAVNGGGEWTTVGMDRVRFHEPARRGDRLRCSCGIAHLGTTSITVECKVYSTFMPGHERLTFEALATQVMIATDQNLKYQAGRPIPFSLYKEVEPFLEEIKQNPMWKLVEKLREERKSDAEILK